MLNLVINLPKFHISRWLYPFERRFDSLVFCTQVTNATKFARILSFCNWLCSLDIETPARDVLDAETKVTLHWIESKRKMPQRITCNSYAYNLKRLTMCCMGDGNVCSSITANCLSERIMINNANGINKQTTQCLQCQFLIMPLIRSTRSMDARWWKNENKRNPFSFLFTKQCAFMQPTVDMAQNTQPYNRID